MTQYKLKEYPSNIKGSFKNLLVRLVQGENRNRLEYC